MKNIASVLIILSVFMSSANGQETSATFGEKDNVIGVGFGLGGVYGFSSYDAQSPVFGAQYDRGVYEFGFGGVIGAGGFLGYKGYVNKYDLGIDDYKIRSSIFIIGARGTFHYGVFKVENLDTYGGVMFAYHIVNETSDAPDYLYDLYDTHGNAAYASIYAGAKYYFTPVFGAYAELGYGVAWLTMGAAFKF